MSGAGKLRRKRRSWKKTIRGLSRQYARKERLRMGSISLAIFMITVLFTSLLTLYVGVELSVGRYEIGHYGTRAHGEVFHVTKEAYEALWADDEVRDAACARMVGALSQETADSRRYYLYYDGQKSLEWEGIRITGSYPQAESDIALSTRLLGLLGLEKEIGQPVTLSYTVMGEAYEETFRLTGYYSSPQIVTSEGYYDGSHYPGTYEKIYVSGKFCDRRLSGCGEEAAKRHYADGKTDGDGLYQVQLQFLHGYDIAGQAADLGQKYGQTVFVNGGWVRVDPLGRTAGNMLLIAAAALLIGLAGGFVIESIFGIPIMEDARFFGLLQTLGVSGRQYRYFLLLQVRSYAVCGIFPGGLAGYALGYALIPMITDHFYGGDVVRYVPFQPWIPCLCMAAGFLVVYLCCFGVARRVSGRSPVEAERLREECAGTRRRKKLYTGAYKSWRFAWKNLSAGKSRTRPVVASVAFLLLLLMGVSTFLRSIDAAYYVRQRLGGLDFLVLSKHAAQGGTLQECALALDELEQDCGLTGSRIGKLEQELTLFDRSGAKRQKEIFDTRPVEAYLTDNGLIDADLPEHLAYLSVFGFDSGVVRQMEVVEGSINAEKYDTGNYVILTANPACTETFAEDCNNPLCALYGVGDAIELYGKSYEVMAVVNVPSVLNACAVSNELPVLMPYEQAAGLSREFCSYGAVYEAAGAQDLEAADQAAGAQDFGAADRAAGAQDFGAADRSADAQDVGMQKMVNRIRTDYRGELEFISRDTVALQLQALSNMMHVVCGVLLLFLAVILLIHAVNVSAFSIHHERRLFALLQSIGMRRRQQREQLCWESVFQVGIAFLAAMGVGSVLSLTVVRKLCDSTAICVYRYSALPVVAAGVLLCAAMSCGAIGAYNRLWKRYQMMNLLKGE